jgi:UDP-glucose 4-epimerase
MRVLVTGGAGYIGSTTAAALLEAGHEVVVADDLSTGHRDAVPAGADLIEVDVTDPAAIGPVVAAGRFDACLHFAALIEAGESMRTPERFFRVNTGGSAVLLDALLRHGVGRFVLSSTAAVYGEPEQVPITEDAALAPTNAYGESKLLVERMLAWHHRIHGLRYAALRYFNAAGAVPGRPERHDPETHLIPLVLQVAAGTREHIMVFGSDYPTPDGTCVRDYVHVADLADAHVRALERLDEHGAIVCNLGNGRGFSVREVVEAARRVTGHPIPAVDAERRPGDPATLVASAERAGDLLGWRPSHTDLDGIVADAWTERR